MLQKVIIGIVLNGLALFGVTSILTNIHYTGGLYFFLIGGVVMGILNSIVKPILKTLTFPLHMLTIGLSLIILNGIIFWIFDVVIDTLALKEITLEIPIFLDKYLSLKIYFFAGLIFGIINWVEHLIIHNK